MKLLQISSVAVKNPLLSLNEHKSPGPDGLHPKLLDKLAPFIAELLAHLSDLYLATGQEPND